MTVPFSHSTACGPAARPGSCVVRARSRHPDGLTIVVDPKRDSDRVAGRQIQLPDRARPWSPDHGFIIENLRPAAVELPAPDGHFGSRVLFSAKPATSPRLLICAPTGVVASQRRERSYHPELPKDTPDIEAVAIAAEVFIIWILRGSFGPNTIWPNWLTPPAPLFGPPSPGTPMSPSFPHTRRVACCVPSATVARPATTPLLVT